MNRRKFFLWSALGALTFALSVLRKKPVQAAAGEWTSLPKEERERLLEKWKEYQGLSFAERMEIDQAWVKWQALPEADRRTIAKRFPAFSQHKMRTRKETRRRQQNVRRANARKKLKESKDESSR
jgi:hypothetical protein